MSVNIFRILARQWIFQTCNEYGWFQTSNSTEHPFGSSFPAALQIIECEDLYDNLFDSISIESKIDNTNILHGALTPIVRNVYSTHGEYDPWRPAGVQTDINESSETFIIPCNYFFRFVCFSINLMVFLFSGYSLC